MKHILLILTLLLTSGSLQAQLDSYDQMKVDYDSLRKEKKYEEALVTAKQMNAWALENESDTSLRYAVSFRYIGNSFFDLNTEDSSLIYNHKSLAVLDNQNRSESIQALYCYKNIGIIYILKKNDFQQAILAYKNGLRLINNSKEIQSDSLKIELQRIFTYNIGSCYRDMDDYNNALVYYKRCLKLLINLNMSTLSCRGNIVWAYKNLAEYISAEEQAIVLLEESRKQNNYKWIGLSFQYLSSIYYSTHRYEKALIFSQNSIDIFSDQNDNWNLANLLNTQGLIYSAISDVENAKFCFNKALDLLNNKSLNNIRQYEIATFRAVLLNNIAMVLEEEREYKEAYYNYERSLGIKKELGNQSLISSAMNNIGVLFLNIGNAEKSLDYFKNSIEIEKNIRNKEHPDLAMAYFNLGEVYMYMQDFDGAESFYLKALNIYKNLFESETPEMAKIYSRLSSNPNYDLDLRESFNRKALKIYRSFFNENHSSVISSLHNLSVIYCHQGNYIKADSVQQITLNNIPPHDTDKFMYISNYHAHTISRYFDKHLEAYKILSKNFDKKSKKISNNFEWLSDNEKEAYWKSESDFYQNLGWFANISYLEVPKAIALNYNGALIVKSKLLENKISKENYYIEVNEIREKLSYRKKLLNKLESDGSDKRELMEKLSHEADSLDKQLELSWPAYAEQKRNLLITWDKVHQNLSDGEAAIEFVRFREDEDSAYQYQALIIRKDLELPVLAPLCFEEELMEISPNAGFSAYYPLVWEPIEEHLKDIHTIYYAPSGELYNIPFHAIYAPKGSGDQEIAAKRNKRGEILTGPETESEEDAEFLMDRYTLHQLTSTRYLALGLKKNEKEKPETSIAMVGGVNYDYLPGQENTKAKKSKKAKNRSSASASGKLSYLEGTKKENESINSTVMTKGWETTYLEGNNAKEESLTQFTDKEAKGILHIATHGYAFPEYTSLDTTIKENSLRYSYRFSQNPMVRSGLILAGGNWAWTGSDTLETLGAEENGILTALEVSGLNLRNTKLVVLSACETGLGKIEGSEGTFGLKRGFKLAGVEQMIVSLWSVPDKETMELMTLFYEDLTQTLDPIQSFEKAQKQMRENYPTRPDLWAGFVLVR
jgi:CHAT domain-containing protein/tetratricopeptide (TPR) repeat protein